MLSRSSFAAACALVACVLAPRSAGACWDGIAAHGDTVHLSISDEEAEWSLEGARAYAELITILDVLTPADAVLHYEFGSVYFDDEDTCPIDLGPDWDGYLAEHDLVDVVAEACGRSPGELDAAQRMSVSLYTIQAASTGSAEAAARVAAKLEETDACHASHGFYEVGGFPSVNPCAHVVEAQLDDGRVVYRVVVGAFLQLGEAEAARAELEREYGREMMVRSV